MPLIVYLNGDYLLESDAFIPVNDRGFLFGDGVFTTIKVNEGHPEFFPFHMEKLARDCKVLGIAPREISIDDIKQIIKKNGAEKGEWRLKVILTGGTSPDLNPKQRSDGLLLMTLRPYTGHSSTFRLCCYPFPICQPQGNVKSLAYLSRLIVVDYAIQQGYDDALVLNPHGVVLDSSIANFCWKVGNEVFFPDPELKHYQGVTLQVFLDAARELGYWSKPIKAKLEEIPDEAQLYLCNSLRGVVPVIAIEDKVYERDEAFEKLLRLRVEQKK